MEDPKVSDLNLKVGLQAVMDCVEFVEPSQQNSNRIRCARCNEATVFYFLGGCEHKPIVCSICYENLGVKACQDCEQAIEDVCREDSQFLDFHVYCPLRKDGCEVVLSLRNVLEHQDECHPSVDLTKHNENAKKKRIDSAGGSSKQQVKENDSESRKLTEDLVKKAGDYEKSTRENRAVERLSNQLALLEEKLNKEIAAKKEMEKRLFDQTKRKSDVVKQELLRQISDQLHQQIDKKIKDAEMKVSNQTSVNLEKMKQEVVKVVTGQVNKQVERQVQECRKKIAEQIIPRTDAEMQKLARKTTDRMEQHFEKQLMDSEKKILEKISKTADMQKKELSKNITEQVSQQTEKRIYKSQAKATSEVSKKAQLPKNEPPRRAKENQSLQAEHKPTETMIDIGVHTEKEFRKNQMKTRNEVKPKQLQEKTVLQMGDVTDSQEQERFHTLFKEVTAQVESQSLEAQNKVFAEFHAAMSKDLNAHVESYALEQVVRATEKQAQGLQKQCDALVNEQIKREMSDMKNFVTKSMGLEIGKQAAELQKMFAKELKAQKQQLEQTNQQFINQIANSQDSACIELKKMAERDKEGFQKLVEARYNLLAKNNTTELQKRMTEELKTHKQDLSTTNQKCLTQLEERHENAGKQLSKKNEADKDKLLRSVEERMIQQSKVNETDLQKRIAKELKLLKLELVQENQQFIAQLRDTQENALKQINKKVEVDKEKWMKYFEERLHQQMKSHLNALSMQMLQDKQELLQANQQSINQLMGIHEIGVNRSNKKIDSQKQGLLLDFKNQMFEQLEKRIALFKNEVSNMPEACSQPQEGIDAMRNALLEHVGKRVQEIQDQLSADLQEAVRTAVHEGIFYFKKDPAASVEITEADGVVIDAASTRVLQHENFKRAVVSEVESSLLKKFRGMTDEKCEKCFLAKEVDASESRESDDDGYVNVKEEVLIENPDSVVNGNSVVHQDHVDSGGDLNDMSHFEHFEAMQRKIFNRQFGNLVNEAHTKIMAVVNELSGPKKDELVTEVALRMNEQLVHMQTTLLGHIDEEIRIRTQEILKCLEETIGDAVTFEVSKANGNGSIQGGIGNDVEVGKEASSIGLGESRGTSVVDSDEDSQTTLMKEWHEENSKLIHMPQGPLVNNVNHKEEIRRLIKEEIASSRLQEDSFVGSNDTATTYVWRVTNFRKKFESLKTSHIKHLTSNEFTVQGTPLKLKAHFMRSQMAHWFSLVMGFVMVDNLEEAVVKSLYSHKRTFVLVDQSQESLRKDRVIVREPGFRDEGVEKWMSRFHGPVCFARVDALEEGSIYVKNNTLIIKIILEPTHALYRSIRNDDGVLFWKIDNYRLQKQAEIDGLVECLYSDYFSTSPKGYRMQIRAYLNGDDQCQSEHLSIYLYFRRGQHDEFIASSFPHRVTFTVLNQSEGGDRNDISKAMESDGHIISAYGFREFMLQSEIESPEYLKNDTLLIKVEVVQLMESMQASSGRNSFLHG